MDQSALILLVGRDPAGGEPIRQMLAEPAGLYRFQSIKHLPTALARLAGGGVDLILLDLSESQAESAGLEGFLQLRAAAPETPIIVLYDSLRQNLAEQAVRAIAANSLASAACETELRRVVGAAIEQSRATIQSSFRPEPRSQECGKVIACMGSKGGAGTTTVGLNIATALARDWNVILAELRPTLGSLSQYCGPTRVNRDLGHLLKMDPAAISQLAAEACLWTYRNVPRLRILFGPQGIEGCTEAGPDHTRAISLALTMLADYVVLDLAVSLSQANRAIIQDSDCLVLVVELDPICVQSAKLILQNMGDWNTGPLTGAVVVNRASLVSPMDLADLESQLSVPLFGSIPPASDLCAFAQNAHTPLLALDPESLVAASLNAVAAELQERIPIIQPVESTGISKAARGVLSVPAKNGTRRSP